MDLKRYWNDWSSTLKGVLVHQGRKKCLMSTNAWSWLGRCFLVYWKGLALTMWNQCGETMRVKLLFMWWWPSHLKNSTIYGDGNCDIEKSALHLKGTSKSVISSMVTEIRGLLDNLPEVSFSEVDRAIRKSAHDLVKLGQSVMHECVMLGLTG